MAAPTKRKLNSVTNNSGDQRSKPASLDLIGSHEEATHVTAPKVHHRALSLLFCVSGIYFFFLTWGVLQERISTVDYTLPSLHNGGASVAGTPWYADWFRRAGLLKEAASLWFVENVICALFPWAKAAAQEHVSVTKFSYFIVLILAQTLGATLVGFLLVRLSTASSRPSPALSRQFPSLSLPLAWAYFKVAISFCCAAPFGYASLKHIDYVTMNLGKSCKLLPVLLMSLLFNKVSGGKGRAIERSKMVGVLLITLGVCGFMVFDEGKKNGTSTHIPWLDRFGSHSLMGLGLLFLNLLFDGATNSWQDHIFHTYGVSALHMMLHMSWMGSVLMGLYLGGFYVLQGVTSELAQAALFLVKYPLALADLCLFALAGALGQAFVFYTIEQFGALSLVTVTVTRKLFTILISVVYFGHVLNLHQWACVGLVFAALIMEAVLSYRKQRTPSSTKMAEIHVETPLRPPSQHQLPKNKQKNMKQRSATTVMKAHLPSPALTSLPSKSR